MLPTRFVQRLKRPYQSSRKYPTLKEARGVRDRIDLPEEAWAVLDPIVTFDWMMYENYDRTRVGQVIESLIEAELSSFEILINRKKIKPHYKRVAFTKRDIKREALRREREGLVPLRWNRRAVAPKDRTIYIISRVEQKEAVEERVRLLARDKIDLLESDKFSRALDPWLQEDRWTCGWLEFDNGFFFTTVDTMWADMGKLLNP